MLEPSYPHGSLRTFEQLRNAIMALTKHAHREWNRSVDNHSHPRYTSHAAERYTAFATLERAIGPEEPDIKLLRYAEIEYVSKSSDLDSQQKAHLTRWITDGVYDKPLRCGHHWNGTYNAT